MKGLNRDRIRQIRTVIAVMGLLLAGYMGIQCQSVWAAAGGSPAGLDEAGRSVCWYLLIWFGFAFAALSAWLNVGKTDR